MSIRALTAYLAVAGLLLACEQQPAEERGETMEPTEPIVDVAAEEQAIRSLADRYEQAFAAKDVETLTSMWVDDAVQITHDGSEISGSQAIRDAQTRDFEGLENPSFEINPSETVIASSGDIAYEVGSYTVRGTGSDGTAIEETHRYLVAFRKENGEWKLAHAMDTAPLAAGTEAPADTGATEPGGTSTGNP